MGNSTFNMIFESVWLQQYILPFLLVFVLIFAILQKTKILGEEKRQVDALVSFAIAMILIAVPQPRDIVVNLMPWLAVGAAVMLVFLLLYGFVAGEEATGQKWQKIVFGILSAVFVLGVVIYVTGLYDIISGWVSGSGSGDLWMNILMFVVIGGAIALVVSTAKKSDKSD